MVLCIGILTLRNGYKKPPPKDGRGYIKMPMSITGIVQ